MIHRLAIERVNETKAGGDSSAGPLEHACVANESPLARESRAPQLRVVFRPAEAGGENTGHEVAPCHTRSLQQCLFFRAERLHLLMDHGGQAFRDAFSHVVEIGCGPPTVRLEHHRRGRFPVVDQGQNEKRIAAGPLVDRVHQSPIGSDAGKRAVDHGLDRIGTQQAGADHAALPADFQPLG